MKKIVFIFLLFNSVFIFSQKLKLPKGWNLISLKGKPAYINLVTGKVTREFPKKVKENLDFIIEEEDDDDEIFDPTITHKIKKGETVESIAQKYDLTTDDLFQLNNSKVIKELVVGKDIIIGYAHNMEEKKAFLKGDISVLKHEH
ncbi:LysM peptidoglycan-binding domain-containing protein [Tenacibaculum sp. S7007]|uniref:LysM peptidoglycan-binding domain-containing protein n=1 Tax=Tenacibaculum pelagium TaxID=2759527 RepID=A0A839AIC0_9FLAO|nr:LysM domain-containing protein [Tenacibaculum pelagium]MBA6154942.1 LysM peptidoglycan-binding domain-containing protein [Tenacibaculum pelagium]